MMSDLSETRQKRWSACAQPFPQNTRPLQLFGATRYEIQLPRSCHTGETRCKPLRHRERFSLLCPHAVVMRSGDPSPRPVPLPGVAFCQTSILSLDCRSVSKIIAVAVDRHTIFGVTCCAVVTTGSLRAAPSDLEGGHCSCYCTGCLAS